MMIGSAEKAGSGVSKIIYGWEYAQWRRPYLLVETQPDRLILELPKFSIIPDETLHSLRNLFGDRVDSLGKDELNILSICHIEKEVNNNRLQDSIDKHKTDITKILQELCKEGFLISENKSRWTTYHLNANFANLDESKVDTSEQKVGSSETLTPNLDTSDLKVDTSVQKVDTSVQKVDTSIKKETKNLPKDKLNDLILNTCKLEFLTIDQIAREVNKSSTYLQNKVLPNLVNSGKLKRLYPDNPNNPNQAYKAAE